MQVLVHVLMAWRGGTRTCMRAGAACEGMREGVREGVHKGLIKAWRGRVGT